MRALIAGLIVTLVSLQYRLWVGEGSIAEVRALQRQLMQQQRELDDLTSTNRALSAEVDSLRNDLRAIEARARAELGMIRDGETYFQLVRPGGDNGE